MKATHSARFWVLRALLVYGRGFDLFIRQRSLQNFTSSQTRSHFLRQVKDLPHAGHTFSGRCCFFTPFIADSLTLTQAESRVPALGDTMM